MSDVVASIRYVLSVKNAKAASETDSLKAVYVDFSVVTRELLCQLSRLMTDRVTVGKKHIAAAVVGSHKGA